MQHILGSLFNYQLQLSGCLVQYKGQLACQRSETIPAEQPGGWLITTNQEQEQD
ncbi:hypothetical protein KKJ06_09690 [Xenorhabdus bovienii]|uniref:hypothetical protein n=1 Tax=Xenorhabdus bovienii TaxID=40576 RepID=UPI0023B26A80|nr:hypothetical protein [Xenorhabdus bovienii]MDE9480427.1 hypothetical protein [Xenorhabdus bovienii]MDE9535225.1 hypothetical protein [Xenorhabdus bovienii]MDE9543032.1 hypothetical protein [Xenorhabdus bovienii]MDE9551616.1 hypothetical protein [Xenorhabdus bovienii]MDE9555693.1 hypothetical protein [Xenorhabdus bovienii]